MVLVPSEYPKFHGPPPVKLTVRLAEELKQIDCVPDNVAVGGGFKVMEAEPETVPDPQLLLKVKGV